VRGGRGLASKVKSAMKRIPPIYAALKITTEMLQVPFRGCAELKFLYASYHRLKSIDLLLISGSNQFLDNYGGVWGYPYTLFKWSVLAKLVGAKLAFVSVGAGPLDSKISRMLVRACLLLSDYASFRDQASKNLIETALHPNKGSVFPDLAHSLQIESAHALATEPDGKLLTDRKRLTVAINPMPVYERRYWFIADDAKYLAYVRKLASFASTLWREGYPVFFFSTMPKDENVIQDVMAFLDEDIKQKTNAADVVKSSRSVYELMKTLLGADIVVATRFHGIVLSLVAEKPVIGICYYRKSGDLLEKYGQQFYGVPLEHLMLQIYWSALGSWSSITRKKEGKFRMGTSKAGVLWMISMMFFAIC
jgi:polysaccharide pyruvyl transferase WcaK-like protein